MLCAVDIITWNLHEDARRVSVTRLVLCLQAVIYKPDSVNVNQVCSNVKRSNPQICAPFLLQLNLNLGQSLHSIVTGVWLA